ncbi:MULTISPECIES: DUF7146 domain-containing protein [Roseomonadaceae]|uniref:Toprim domain-containing protein n=1 Tax=Falsiroseomonas oleicola TaxID=2801474 RepID=A0ABS6H6K6_9PROT|nr:toprim domain-containing protein [Roseomonas oleicola]MBU8544323.1 toprim domain-containing protein [Roseomonas oleicola]
MSTAPEIAALLGGRKAAGGGFIANCPSCGGKNCFRVSQNREKTLWWCAYCQDQRAITAAVLAIIGGQAPMAPSVAPATSRQAAPSGDAALGLWSRVVPWRDTPVASYLALRLPGVALPALPDIGFLPQAKHPAGVRLPCMVALLRDVHGVPTAVHRTFLAPGGVGKAAVEPVRMTLGNVRGSALRIFPVAERLVVGEGIETSLAAGHLLRLPAWAAISAGNLGQTVALPPEVREVVLAMDVDGPGRAAAAKAAVRWKAEGRKVQLAKPHREGQDFADVLAERAKRV